MDIQEVFTCIREKESLLLLGEMHWEILLREQMEAVKTTAKALCDLIEEGHQVVVVHGNGPQVGMINNAMAALSREDANEPYFLFPSVWLSVRLYLAMISRMLLREELRETWFYAHPCCNCSYPGSCQ